MKKYYLHLFFILLLCMISKNVLAYDIKVPNADGVMIYYNYINDGTELEVTYQNLHNYESCEYCGNVVIPEEVTFETHILKVTKIGDKAFGNCYYDLTSITIPNNVAPWKDFGSILALTDDDPKPTGINATTATQLPTIVERYTIDGKRIIIPQSGLNIVKMSDGTTKKIIVK